MAHLHGVIHRDVKPANIMVSHEGEVKITDFGVSRSTNQGQITQDGMVVGTAQYISPEQAQGEPATPQSDIYSLGVVAYEGLCGHRPFTGRTPVDIAAAHVNSPVPPLPDSIDPQLREYVMRMLAKDPHDRPKSALEVAKELGRIERRILDKEARAATGEFNEITGNFKLRRVRSDMVIPRYFMFKDGTILDQYDHRVVVKPYASDTDPGTPGAGTTGEAGMHIDRNNDSNTKEDAQ